MTTELDLNSANLYAFEKPRGRALQMAAFWGKHRVQAQRNLRGDKEIRLTTRLGAIDFRRLVGICKALERNIRPEHYFITLKSQSGRFYATNIEDIAVEQERDCLGRDIESILDNLHYVTIDFEDEESREGDFIKFTASRSVRDRGFLVEVSMSEIMSYDPMMADFLSEAFADNGVWTAQIFYKKAIDLMLKGKTKGHKSLVGPVPKLWLLGGQPETTPLYKKCYRTWEL